MRDDAIKTTVDTSKSQAIRDEACGIIKSVEILMELPEQLAAFRKLVEQPEIKENK